MNWQYDPRDDSWKFGTEMNGGGVFRYDIEWSGNAVNDGEILMCGYFKTKEAAMADVESEWRKRSSPEDD